MKNIEELNATIEELEKRIKAISSAGATLAQIIAVRDSLEQVKVCLNNLTTAIKDEEDDASVAQLTALEQRVTTAETDITTLQTDLTSTQDDLETVWNNLASTNSVVGEHTTTLTNLQTAQTNLQTTQTNQASTITTNTTDISNLKTRMTTAENNISALTNCVDVDKFDKRITELENYKIDNYLCLEDLIMLLNLNNESGYTRKYAYKIDECDYVEETFTIKYTTSLTDTFNLKLLKNGVQVEDIPIDLTTYPSSYTIKREFKPTENLQYYQFLITCSGEIKFTGLRTKIVGKNPIIFDNDSDLKVECFNNNVYLTKYENNQIYVGHCSIDTFDLDNFTYTQFSLPNYNIRAATYGPNIKSTGQVCFSNNDIYAFELTSNKIRFNEYNTDYSLSGNGCQHDADISGRLSLNTFFGGGVFYINNYKPRIFYPYSSGLASGALKQVENFLPGKTYFAEICRANYYIDHVSPVVNEKDVKALCVYEDGNIYITYNSPVTKIVKVARAGKSQQGFLQSDGSINVYITKFNNTYKYKVENATNLYSVSFVEKIENCDYVYELCNGRLIIHTPTGWQLKPLTEQIEETT